MRKKNTSQFHVIFITRNKKNINMSLGCGSDFLKARKKRGEKNWAEISGSCRRGLILLTRYF